METTEIGSHTTCVITSTEFDKIFYLETPNFRFHCDSEIVEYDNSSIFVQKLTWGIENGCSHFLMSLDCVPQFLELFIKTHFYSEVKYEKKVLVILGDDIEILNATVIVQEIPLTLLLKEPELNGNFDESASIEIFSTFPFSQMGKLRNKLFLVNETFLRDEKLVPEILDLDGYPVNAGFIHIPPFASGYRVPPGTGNALTYGTNEPFSTDLGGTEGILLMEFCKKFNCTLYVHFDYHETLWGEIYPNMTGRGVLADIATNKMQLAAGDFYVVHNRNPYMRYSTMMQLSTVPHAVPKPMPLPYWYIPILPFTTAAWLCFLASLFVGAYALLALDRARSKVFPYSEIRHQSGVDAFLAVLKISVNQGITIISNVSSSLIMYATFMIYALTLGSFYIGGLSSLMTVMPTESPINTIAKLVQTSYHWGTTSNTYLFPIQHSTDPAFVIYAKNFKTYPVAKYHALVKQFKAAVLVETMQGGTLCYQDYIDKNDSKFLMIMKEPLYTSYTAPISTKTWPYMEQLNRIVFMQVESGIGTYWEYRSAEQTVDAEIQNNLMENSRKVANPEPVKLTISHILGPLFLLLFGMVFGLVAFIAENLWGNDKKLLKVVQKKFTAVLRVVQGEL
ncbi:uncharacterized protein LOC134828520 [Culicoides brevitarsis]|uniref:uncharacterized protein LOC134828520 n=1 Tax=Culicoides brevitarsis TaxID=469753 RepID=UPI00307BC63F